MNRAAASGIGAALSLGLLLLAAACSKPPQPAAQRDVAAQAPAPVHDPAQVLGEWDVVSFEGYRPQRLMGGSRAAFADFGPEGVRLRIECNYSGRGGKIGKAASTRLFRTSRRDRR
jgi:hypothetical protein